MNDRVMRQLIPRLEAMEHRVALSATALAIHDVPAAHAKSTSGNPVILNLDPQATGITITGAEVVKRFGVVRIEGVAKFPALSPSPTAAYISVSVTEKTGPRNSSYGYATSDPMTYVSTGFTSPFTLYVTPEGMRFRRGTAQVTISTSSSSDYYGSPLAPSADAMVRLTPVGLTST